jgi:hypothetical protein
VGGRYLPLVQNYHRQIPEQTRTKKPETGWFVHINGGLEPAVGRPEEPLVKIFLTPADRGRNLEGAAELIVFGRFWVAFGQADSDAIKKSASTLA